MKNIKGYYSWIHSLNNAAIESQNKAFKMLNEAREGGKDVDLQAQLRARKMSMGRDTIQGGQNKKDVEPVGDANAVDIDNDDGVMGDDVPMGDQYLTQVPATKLPAITSGAFPPPSAQHPAPQFPTPEAASAELARLNAPAREQSDKAKVRAFHQEEATKAAKAAVEAARKAGKSPAAQRAAAVKAVEDYKNLRRKELTAEPPERTTEVEGGMLPMESVSQKIDRLLNG